jgi:hypothetical protein
MANSDAVKVVSATRIARVLSLLVIVLVLGASTAAAPAPEGGLNVPQAAEEPAEPLPGEDELLALREAYPEVIRDVAVRDGEWTVLLGDTWYYWADGRLLPGELRDRADEYVQIRFYNYTMGPLTLPEVPPELGARLRDRTEQITSSADDQLRFNDFLDTLYGISSRAEAEATVVSISFLGMGTRVHPFLREPLERVERRIRDAMQTSPEVTAFVEGLSSVHAYNWRNIAGTQRRSYHSYGVALDLVPRTYAGRWAYWLWAAESGVDEWWNLSLEERWSIPQPVVDAFEAEGFIWGAKWLFFDHLHFEYRPESILMARWRDATEGDPVAQTPGRPSP